MIRRFILLLLPLVMLVGCLPSSQWRGTTHTLFPADSLSRQIAETFPRDTLRLMWTAESETWVRPRTVSFAADGSLYMADLGTQTLTVFDDQGTIQHEITDEALEFPYLSGWRGDTLGVLNPAQGTFSFVAENRVQHTISLPEKSERSHPLMYANLSDNGLFFKAVGHEFEGYLTSLDDTGQPMGERLALTAPVWRYAGNMRRWGEELISLCGYRPVVDVIAGGTVDTLALRGFDSPMLDRSRQLALGQIRPDEAPILTASAAPHGDWLFVLNLRQGWHQVDVYDRAGQLQHILVQGEPFYEPFDFAPADVAVRQVDAQTLDIAIVNAVPAQVFVYRWVVSGAAPAVP